MRVEVAYLQREQAILSVVDGSWVRIMDMTSISSPRLHFAQFNGIHLNVAVMLYIMHGG